MRKAADLVDAAEGALHVLREGARRVVLRLDDDEDVHAVAGARGEIAVVRRHLGDELRLERDGHGDLVPAARSRREQDGEHGERGEHA